MKLSVKVDWRLLCTMVHWPLHLFNGIAEFAGLEFAGLENDGLENDGLKSENDGVEQEQTYAL